MTSPVEELSESKDHSASGEDTLELRFGFVVQVPGYSWETSNYNDERYTA